MLGQGNAVVQAQLRTITENAADGDDRIRYVHLAHRGLSRARNAAMSEAGGDIVAFLDDDCEADPNWLSVIAEGFANDPDLGVVGGAVVPAGIPHPLSSCPSLAPTESIYDPAITPQTPPAGWDWIGANFALRSRLAERIGPWDEHLGAGAEFPAGEDTDYKLRLEALKVRMLATPRSMIHHSSGTRVAREAWRSQRNYALGNGALAAKLTLSGDPRGREWLAQTRREGAMGWLRPGRRLRAPIDVRRALWFEVGYWRCLQGYRVDGAGVLCLHSSGITAAFILRGSLRSSGDAPVVLPVAGGAGGLLDRVGYTRLASVLDPATVARSRRGAGAWLERRQARRSAVTFVPDRATAIEFAGRWGLDLARVRLAPDLTDPPAEVVESLCGAARYGRNSPRPWYATS